MKSLFNNYLGKKTRIYVIYLQRFNPLNSIYKATEKKLLKKDALDLHKCVDIINKVNQQSINFID